MTGHAYRPGPPTGSAAAHPPSRLTGRSVGRWIGRHTPMFLVRPGLRLAARFCPEILGRAIADAGLPPEKEAEARALLFDGVDSDG